MGNCLVTKLKGSVNNDTLPIIDKIRVNISGSIIEYFDYMNAPSRYQASGVATTITVDNGAYFVNRTTQANIGSSLTISPSTINRSDNIHNLVIPNGSTVVTYERYKAPFISGETFKATEDLKMCNNIYSLRLSSLIDFDELPDGILEYSGGYKGGDISKKADIIRLAFISGDIQTSKIANNTGLSVLVLSSCGSGDVVEFEELVNISTLNLLSNPYLTGSLDNLLNTWASKGKTGTMRLQIGGNSNLTLSSTLMAISDFTTHNIVFASGNWTVQS